MDDLKENENSCRGMGGCAYLLEWIIYRKEYIFIIT